MPAVITDPSLQPGIVSQGTSLFEYPDTPAPSILNFQAIPTQPQPGRTSTATGLLCPPLLISEMLRNFPDEVYNLSPTTALVHFMQAMLGPTGAGQLRQSQQFARLQSAITSTNFYDLDSFYGALFGALRGPDGSLPQNPSTGVTFNPYTDLATPDGWDDITTADAIFRERIIALARAITLGGTVPGLQALGEAITGAECEVYQVWSLVDSQGAQGGTGHTWSSLQGQFATWSAIPPTETWNLMQGVTIIGGMGLNARNEVIIQPKKNYTTDLAGQQQQAADAWGIMKVARVLAPAFAIVSVAPQGLTVNTPVPIVSLWADSEFWEVIPKVTPAQPGDPAYAVMLEAYSRSTGRQAPGQQLTDVAIPQAKPPFSSSQGTQYSCVSAVSKVNSLVIQQPRKPPDANTAIRAASDDETVHFPDGTSTTYKAAWALMEPSRAASARVASTVSSISSPYTGPRSPVVTHG